MAMFHPGKLIDIVTVARALIQIQAEGFELEVMYKAQIAKYIRAIEEKSETPIPMDPEFARVLKEKSKAARGMEWPHTMTPLEVLRYFA